MSLKGMLTRLLQGSPNSASIAKERLQIILSQQRGARSLDGVDVAKMQDQIRQVVSRFMKVDDGDISWTVKPSEEDAGFDVFEMQVQLQPRPGAPRDTPKAR